MSTFSELVDEVLMHLSGYGMRNSALTHLTQAASSSATQLTVNSAESIGKGVIEIGDEQIWVDSADRTTGVLAVPPYGRGFNRTTAASHSSGDMVTVNPQYSRQVVKKALNDTIRTCGLNGVGYHTFAYSPSVTTYSLPEEVDDVLSVSFQAIGPSQEWVPVRNWRFDSTANASALNSTKSLTLGSAVDIGATVQIAYSFDPEELDAATDDFESVTGLDVKAQDVIILGAAYRLLSFIDPGRSQYVTPESDLQSGNVPAGSGTNVAKYVYALYQQRLAEEKQRFVSKYSKRVHYTK